MNKIWGRTIIALYQFLDVIKNTNIWNADFYILSVIGISFPFIFYCIGL